MTDALETTFAFIKIGIKDVNGLELFNGDNVEIYVSSNTKQTGTIVYDYGAFCLKAKRNDTGTETITPLRNYASYCIITKIK